jgi:hypothetical protein
MHVGVSIDAGLLSLIYCRRMVLDMVLDMVLAGVVTGLCAGEMVVSFCQGSLGSLAGG